MIYAGLYTINYNINLHVFGKVTFFPISLFVREDFFSFFFFGCPIAYGVSQDKDQIQTVVVTYAAGLATPDS